MLQCFGAGLDKGLEDLQIAIFLQGEVFQVVEVAQVTGQLTGSLALEQRSENTGHIIVMCSVDLDRYPGAALVGQRPAGPNDEDPQLCEVGDHVVDLEPDGAGDLAEVETAEVGELDNVREERDSLHHLNDFSDMLVRTILRR